MAMHSGAFSGVIEDGLNALGLGGKVDAVKQQIREEAGAGAADAVKIPLLIVGAVAFTALGLSLWSVFQSK